MRQLDNKKHLNAQEQTIVQHSTHCIISFDCNYRITGWNPACEKSFEINAIVAIGKNVLDVLSPPTQVAEDIKFLDQILSGNILDQSMVLRPKGGDQWFPSWSRGFPITDDRGDIIGGTILLSDCSASEYIYDMLSEIQGVGSIAGWQFFPSDQSIKITKEAAELLVPEASDWQHFTDFNRFLAKGSWNKFQEAIQESIQTGESGEIEVISHEESDRIFLLNWKTKKVDGKVVRIFGTIKDITKEKDAQKTIANQELQLISSSRLAAIGELAAGIAHEINNPLAIVSNGIQLLARQARLGKLDKKLLDMMLPKIEGGVDRVTKIINSLLRFSGPQLSATDVKPVDMLEVLSEVNSLTSSELAGIQIEYDEQFAKVSHVVQGRFNDLVQVFLSLIKNAKEAIQETSPKSRLIQLSTSEQNGYLVVSISNSGPKMTTEVADKVFQPFFSTKEPGKGTGLGLTVSYTIIDEHNGRLFVDPHENRTTFVVELPLVKKS